jgi:flagellar assembly protein FliH
MRCLPEPWDTGAIEQQPAPLVEAFEFPVMPAAQPELWHDLREVGSPDGPHDAGKSGSRAHGRNGVPQEDLREANAADATRSFEAGREQGIREGRELQRKEQLTAQLTAQLDANTKQTTAAAELVEQFTQQRDRFLEQAEQEVARLALAIAARILRREAEIDPLFLTGAVRVALGQLAEKTSVSLHVPAEDANLWKETLAQLPNLRIRPSVISDEQLHSGDCLVETELGSADLGVHAQLGEIARCLFQDARESTTQQSQHSRSSKAQS